MANIVENTFTKQNTPFYFDHVPYSENPIDLLQQMISYSIVPGTTRTINYEIGAENSFQFELQMRNMTLNETLAVEVITDVMFGNQRYTLQIDPGQDVSIPIELSKEETYGIPRGVPLTSTVSFIVRNTESGNIVFKNEDLMEIEIQDLPTTFDIF